MTDLRVYSVLEFSAMLSEVMMVITALRDVKTSPLSIPIVAQKSALLSHVVRSVP